MQTGIDIKSSLKSLDFVEGNLTNALNYSINTVQSVVGFVISFFTAIIISFFMAKDMDKFKENVLEHSYDRKIIMNYFSLILLLLYLF